MNWETDEWDLIENSNALNEDLENKIDSDDEKKDLIQQFVHDIHKRLDEIKSNIPLVIDRIEGNIAVCENRETEEIKNIDINELPENIHEGDVIKQSNGIYELDEQTKLEIQERIKNKIRNLFEETED